VTPESVKLVSKVRRNPKAVDGFLDLIEPPDEFLFLLAGESAGGFPFEVEERAVTPINPQLNPPSIGHREETDGRVQDQQSRDEHNQDPVEKAGEPE
jgi:hypothetical protein